MELKKYFKENYTNAIIDEPLKKHCTFKVGGNADVFFPPANMDELKSGLKYLKDNNINYFVIGNGSNLLFSDEGYRGVIISLKNFKNVEKYSDTLVKVDSGCTLAGLCKFALQESLTGLEFASGIPGTVGGGIYMNAGAYGGELKDVLFSCRFIDETGEIVTLTNKELLLGYRTSIFKEKNWVIIDAIFELKKGCYDDIKNKMSELIEMRNSKQPVDKPSAGSTFKRPTGYFAGKLIMDSNLRGYKIGGAMVSDKHCGFIINNGEATAKDIVDLMNYVTSVVKEKYNVELEAEVKLIGFH